MADLSDDKLALRARLKEIEAQEKTARLLARQQRLEQTVAKLKDRGVKFSTQFDVLTKKLDDCSAALKRNKKDLAAAEKKLADFLANKEGAK